MHLVFRKNSFSKPRQNRVFLPKKCTVFSRVSYNNTETLIFDLFAFLKKRWLYNHICKRNQKKVVPFIFLKKNKMHHLRKKVVHLFFCGNFLKKNQMRHLRKKVVHLFLVPFIFLWKNWAKKKCTKNKNAPPT